MNRRQLLQRGLLGGTILAAAGFGLWPPSRRLAPTQTRVLTDRTAATLGAIAARVTLDVMDPRRVVERIDASLVDAAPEVKSDINRALLLFDNALAGLFDGHLGPFSTLSPEAQDRTLMSWRDSSLLVKRSGYQVLRRLCLTACYADRSTHLALGYPGPRPTGGLNYEDSKAGT